MTLIVEIEEFLKETRCHIVETARNDAVVMICVPREQATEPATPTIDIDDDDLITWEDAAWQ